MFVVSIPIVTVILVGLYLVAYNSSYSVLYNNHSMQVKDAAVQLSSSINTVFQGYQDNLLDLSQDSSSILMGAKLEATVIPQL
jgi:hypothetical protein